MGLLSFLSGQTAGTWKPTLFGDLVPGTPLYTDQIGSWEKTGRLVTFRFGVRAQSLGGAQGSLCIGGLPFTTNPVANDVGAGAINYASGILLDPGFTQLQLCVGPGWNGINVAKWGSGDGTVFLRISECAPSVMLVGAGAYRTA